jgi:tryptophan-rich sensory protein
MKRSALIIGLITAIIALIGTIFVASSMQWYHSLRLATFVPANWVFAAAWTLIYTLTATAVYLVWERFARNKQFWIIIALFCINALLNIAWPYIFFYHHSIFIGLIGAFLMFITVLALIIMIGTQSLLIASLLTPYLAWLVYAIILNTVIWIMNI